MTHNIASVGWRSVASLGCLLLASGCGADGPGPVLVGPDAGGVPGTNAGAASTTGSTVAATAGGSTGSTTGATAATTGQPPATSGSGSATGEPAATDGEEGCPTFDSAFAAIQEVIFERHGCTDKNCHGDAAAGGLNLTPDVAYANLVDVASSNSEEARVQPGSATESFLYKKLLAATDPDNAFPINGSPMPVGATPLTEKELQAVQLWIQKGAPETGEVADLTKDSVDVGSLLDACLPPVGVVPVTPLKAPPPEEGIQFVLPEYLLKAGTEVENCTPFAYDFTDQVPDEYKDEARSVMFVKSLRVRQDPVSHHMVVWNPAKGLTEADTSTPWTCKGGPNAGQVCDPLNGSADCAGGEGDGVCGGETTQGTLCGIDTTSLANGGDTDIFNLFDVLLQLGALGGLPEQIANTQSPQEYLPPMPGGVYWEVPLKGVLWFNSHAFNLTEEDATLHARMNYEYAQDRRRKMVPINVVKNEIPDGQPPFTRKEYCETYEVPQNNSIAIMTGHTHRRGERFWVYDQTGEQIYENFVYNDPEYKRFDPWLEFPSSNVADRTLKFCAMFNNGLNDDGSYDLYRVTRKSLMPEVTDCVPEACVSGDVGAPCTTDADCGADAEPGACDACPITTGTTTENEMFVLMPWLIEPPQN